MTAQVLPHIVPSVATEIRRRPAASERDTRMLKKLKAPLTAILLSSVAVVPAAAISFVATTDVAFAKSDKAGGNGNGKGGGGNSKSSRSKGKSGSKSASSSSRGGSKSRGGGFGRFMDKLTGKDKAAARKQSMAKVAKDDPMHPSNLGNMNGALNANENAIAAHIRNGNTNGPVGLMAAYVSGRATTENAVEELGEGAGDYIELNDALVENGYVDEDGNPDLEA